MTLAKQVHEFESIEARDEWIDANYPERKMTSTPGLFAVDGGGLGVFLREVTFYPGKSPRAVYPKRRPLEVIAEQERNSRWGL